MVSNSQFTPETETQQASANESQISWVELAKRLGFSRRAVYTWREMPDAPQVPDLVQWAAFIEDHGLGKRDTKSLTELKSDVEREKLRKLKRENEVAERKIVAVDEAVSLLAEMAAKLDLLLTQKLETELPPLVIGQPIAQVRAECRRVHDEIRAVTKDGLLDWSPDGDA
jgi:hypothetical protein